MSDCESARNAVVADLHTACGLGDYSAHLLRCDECRSFLVRTRRMALTAGGGEPTAAEVLRLRVRLGQGIPSLSNARARRPAPLRPALILGFVLLSATMAAAATTNGERWLQAVGFGRSESAANVASSPVSEVAKPALRAAPEKPSETASEAVRVEDLAVEPPVVGSTSAPGARRSEPGARKVEGKWADVASSLRTGDYGGAERSLGELTESSDLGTRDNARLSLAQLWMQQGKHSAARAVLLDLNASGATPFIRRRAGELLRR